MIRVLLADDDALVRAGLAMILQSDSHMEVVGQAGNADEAVTVAAEAAPDVVVMDIRMPGGDGISAIPRLRALPHPPRILMLTTFHQQDYVLRAMEAGAAGFLLKDTPPTDLIEAVRTAAAGGAVLSPEDCRTLADGFSRVGAMRRAESARDVLDPLSDREREVAEAVAEGLSNAQIARRLTCSEATVKAHLSRVFGKVGASGRVEVALLVHQAGLAG